jgi:hypothetical protein
VPHVVEPELAETCRTLRVPVAAPERRGIQVLAGLAREDEIVPPGEELALQQACEPLRDLPVRASSRSP